MAEHTPGPWEVDYDGDSDSMGLILAEGRKPVEIVAATRMLMKGPPGEELANAQLIAAAPALLEALEYVEGLLVSDTAACKRIHAAIAKATGQEVTCG